jgi:hypothetical protein
VRRKIHDDPEPDGDRSGRAEGAHPLSEPPRTIQIEHRQDVGDHAAVGVHVAVDDDRRKDSGIADVASMSVRKRVRPSPDTAARAPRPTCGGGEVEVRCGDRELSTIAEGRLELVAAYGRRRRS